MDEKDETATSPAIGSNDEKKWNLSNIGPLPYPYPPLMEWICEHVKRVECPNFDELLTWTNIIAVHIRIERTKAKKRIHPQNAELLESLKIVRRAAGELAEHLPKLVKSAKIELTRPPLLRGESDVEKFLFESLKQAQSENQSALNIEIDLLAAVQRLLANEGFYGMALQGRRQEPWAENASLLFVWLGIAFEKAGMSVPKRTKISERTPMVKVIREALLWTGYGDRGLSTVAQSLKRDRTPEPPEVGIVPLSRTALVEAALMRTKRK